MTLRSTVDEKTEDQAADQKQPSGQPESGGAAGSQDKKKNSAAEWITFTVSLSIVVALAGVLLFLTVTSPNAPAVIEVKMLKEQVRHRGEVYYLPLEITNQGDRAAEEVTVSIKLTPAGGSGDQPEPEEKEVTIALLAGGSTGDAVVAFKHDPSGGELETEIISYVKP